MQDKKFLWQAASVLALIIALVSIPWLSNWIPFFRINHSIKPNFGESAILATSTINISDIFAGYDDKKYTSDKRDFLTTYRNTSIQGLGSFVDRDKLGDRYVITLQISSYKVDCYFGADSETEKRLLLLKKPQNIAFSGVFTASVHGDGQRGWIVDDCKLK